MKAYGQYHADIESDMEEMRKKKVDPFLIKCLARGIGMHFEGLSNNYRKVVEVMFRRGYLKVVFASGTLAMGINMPCRSTIFTGNETELNGLMFRQMAGRAGRRGFDLLGNVIFMGVPFQKISQLVASDLPTLTGEMNISPVTLLRVLVKQRMLALKNATAGTSLRLNSKQIVPNRA